MAAEIEIGGKKFQARGLRLSEVGSAKMRRLGYGRFAFAPELGDGDQQERLSEIMDAALLLVFGKDGIEAIDAAGGVAGLSAAWRAIIDETYGRRGEEKNSSTAGSGNATPGGSPTVGPAKEAATDAMSASMDVHQS